MGLLLYVTLPLVLLSFAAQGAPSSLTYQGRIMKSSGEPLEVNGVNFIFELTSPDGSCVIYRELKSGIDMRNSSGVFDVAIGTGSRQYPASGTSTVLDYFNNSKSYTCANSDNTDSTSTFSAATTDGRKLRVTFWDGFGWQLISPDTVVRSVPYAAYSLASEKLGTLSQNDVALKTQLPAANCSSGEVLTYSGNTFTCVADQLGSTGSGIQSINGDLATAHALAVNATGSILNWTHSSGVHTLNLPLAANSGVAAGLLSNSDYQSFQAKQNALGFTPLNPANNLSDVTNAATARANLGLSTAGGDLTGTYPSPTIAANAVTTSKLFANPGVNRIVATDNSTGATLKPFTCSSQGQSLTWDTTNGWQCSSALGFTPLNPANNLSDLANAATARANLGLSTAGGDLTGTYPSPTIAANAVTTSKLFANPGINRLVATDNSTGATLKPFTCSSQGQSLTWDTTNGWQCGSVGSLTAVTASAPLTSSGGSSPNIAITQASGSTNGYLTSTDWNTFNNKQSSLGFTPLNPANNLSDVANAATARANLGLSTAGGDLTGTYPNPTIAKLSGKAITLTSLASGNYLKYNGTDWVNVLPSTADLSDASSLIKSSQMPGNCTASQTLTFSSPTGTWTCSTISITGSAFGTQTAGTFFAGPTTGSATPTFRAIASSDLPKTGTGGVFVNGGNSFGANATLGTTDAFNLVLRTGNTDRATFDTSGNLAIGTSTAGAVPGASRYLTLYTNQGPTSLELVGKESGGALLSQIDFVKASANLPSASIRAINGSLWAQSAHLTFLTSPNTSGPVERMRIDPNGLIGVGTTSPQVPFHVTTPVSATAVWPYRAGILVEGEGTSPSGRINTLTYSDTEIPTFSLLRAKSAKATPGAIVANDSLGQVTAIGYTGSAFQTGGKTAINFYAAENFTSSTQGSRISFATTALGTTTTADRVTIDSTGYVGIGTIAPTKSLHILNSQAADTAVLVRNPSSVDNAASAIDIETDGTGLQMIAYSTGTTGTWGTSTIPKADSVVLRSYTTTPPSSMGVGTGSNVPLHLITADTPRITLTGAGNVGIGTTNPTDPLAFEKDFDGDAFFNVNNNSTGTSARAGVVLTNRGTAYGASSGGLILGGSAHSASPDVLNLFTNSSITNGVKISATGASAPITFATSAAPLERMRITASGTVGIGTTAPAYPLDVVGDIRTSSCLRYASSTLGTCTSDVRLKKDIHAFDLGLKELLGINPKYFKYNGLGEEAETKAEQMGVIAQEIEKVAPSLVGTKMAKLHPTDKDKTELKVVNYSAFIYVAINAIKEFYSQWHADSQILHREIASLKEQNDQLKIQNDKLQQRLDKIEKALQSK
ncbi:tail fiber domain-containing protein [Bdellovibrio sp. NC01]|uniref:tail fiber domain-containing protein n=1 Tax=Bdellovibrio sp. NC01 TaxID=2220073 RepID=UPI0011570A22|nr:tail fiber domain-containing protein [Bdellovibrio sp. NC01]QDK37631.1 hypothetical protein DOE51_08580 [Bdellovibrio sp. NC01]